MKKNKKVRLNYRGEKLDLNLKVCNRLEKLSGLMFINQEKAKALLFEFKKPTKMAIHSFFVFFPFVAIWLDTDGKIIDLKIVKSFSIRVSPKKSYQKLIEIPLNKKYSQMTKILVGYRKI